MQPAQWREVVAAATRAPSIHNTQPWAFRPAGDRLEVCADPARALPVLDPSGRQQVISCGAAVEFAVVALRAAGCDVAVDPVPDPARPDLLAVVRTTGGRPAGDDDRALAAAVAERHTERAPFATRPVPADLLDRLETEAAAFGVWCKHVTRPEEQVAAVFLVAEAEQLEVAEPGYRDELRRWLRPGDGAADGVPVDAVPAQDPALRASDWRVRDFVVGSRPPEPAGPVDDDAPPPPVERPEVVVLGTADDDRRAWLDTGRALARTLLRLTVEGLVASPLTQALDLPGTRHRLSVRLSLVGHPQMLLRVGYPAERSAAAGRRPVGDVLRTGTDARDERQRVR